MKVVTALASSTSVTAAVTPAITAPVSTGSAIFKTTQNSTRTINQTTAHDVKTVSQQPASDLGTKGPLDNIYYKGLPKAMVKPNILTHVIEGYVIQEAAEPFAVNRPLREWGTSTSTAAGTATAPADRAETRETRESRDTREAPRDPRDTREGNDKENKYIAPSSDEPPRKKQMLESSGTARISSSSRDDGEAGPSKSCRNQPEESHDQPKVSVAHMWSVSEVCEFIRAIPGCASYADEFLMQEVDGEALLLIKPEHLVMALSMKLGPALKIVACIDALRPENEQAQNDNE